ncbi:RAB geranylgeranyl transferase alpha subunit 1 putative isoform 1 [Tripterygium wilfordii]|uniref:Geranylgeranyl transferase type-2 subunit alpha n=1 Tax=Tripterygium wilfordii TaxID=458696 RepID=A0A7J7C615_TRIWF|nr:geranylgeranyl transferase type-2 subunit alpha 1 isoform X2 [Tripterygium wilfordii]KAF5729287.1 RAB geranylgeranyl transferase alpha subunit 1 putative isoform 1 [Tripterygium wilfordii]
MHGRPRKPLKPEDVAASAAKAQKLRALQSQFLANHHEKNYTKEGLEVSAKLLEINPECSTAWNYRKLAVEHFLSQSESDAGSVKAILDEELRVVVSALRQNYKAYGAWHHRKWVIAEGHSSIDDELKLLDHFQKADSRNFHAWNYRRFVTALNNRSDKDELDYTENMIETNFSNYSAWHNRSVLLSNLLKKKVEGFLSKEDILKKEYEFVHQALFTDPDDQSGWFYHLWLLYQTFNAESPSLISTWPAHGSELTVSSDRFLYGSPSSSTFSTLHFESGKLPLVLYFNQPVEGVNKSTITVKSELSIINDLNWKPLSTNDSHLSQIWVAYLSFHDIKLEALKANSVEVSVWHSQGIFSSSGSLQGQPFQFAFKVNAQEVETDPAARQDGTSISWEDKNFYETKIGEASPILPFRQLNENDDHEPVDSKWHVDIIAEEIDHFRELSEMDCKIGKLTLARLLTAHDALTFPSTNKLVYSEEVLKLYTELIRLDPMHAEYYKDKHSLALLQKVTSCRESLLERCFHYKDLTSLGIGVPVCLRLNNLSISRLGSIENLLWVQMLDLSHNDIRSIEGLEAMQLLSCLCLKNNKLGSVSALEPLRSLKSLKVLDISYNEIGAHSIDTKKYLCSSPFLHLVESERNHDETMTSSINASDYWKFSLIFEGLSLTQLDIAGNAITNENFKSFLVKLLPTLEWLDGEHVL